MRERMQQNYEETVQPMTMVSPLSSYPCLPWCGSKEAGHRTVTVAEMAEISVPLVRVERKNGTFIAVI